MRLSAGRSDVLTTRGAGLAGVVMLLATLFLLREGWCSCTLFALNAWAVIGAAVLLLGNRTFGVLAEEKEKKTLDCLRLTQLSASSLFWYKLAPEFRSLLRLLGAAAPSVLLSAVQTPSGLGSGLGVLAIAALGGALSIISSLFVSSLATSTSRAVVQGWTLKACWLLLTPVLDLVVAAVTVTTTRNPVFDVINPFAAAWPLVVPEAELGMRAHLPLAFTALSLVVGGVMWLVAARRYEEGLTAAPSLTDRQVHQLYRSTPSWIPNILGSRENPVFLRELASQLRSGAGKWPGYAVFVTLFLAPYLYSESWNQRRSSELENGGQVQLRVSEPQPETPALPGANPAVANAAQTPFIRLHSWDGTELRLKGHTQCACLRMSLYNHFHVPLPASAVVKVEYHDPLQMVGETDPQRPGPAEVKLSDTEAASYGVATQAEDTRSQQLTPQTLDQIRVHSMHQGLLGCLLLLSLYLGVRCSGFLANAVTSERDRRSWTDLALTGIGPQQVLQGKLVGTLLMPAIQMLVAAPALLVFVAAGAISLVNVVQLISYAILLAVTAGLVGFWASSSSANSHSAQGLALASILSWLVVTPVVASVFGPLLILPLAGAGLIAASRGRTGAGMGWCLVASASLLAPMGLSPWSALPAAILSGSALVWVAGMLTLTGLSLVCYHSTLANLQQPGEADALRADLVA